MATDTNKSGEVIVRVQGLHRPMDRAKLEQSSNYFRRAFRFQGIEHSSNVVGLGDFTESTESATIVLDLIRDCENPQVINLPAPEVAFEIIQLVHYLDPPSDTSGGAQLSGLANRCIERDFQAIAAKLKEDRESNVDNGDSTILWDTIRKSPHAYGPYWRFFQSLATESHHLRLSEQGIRYIETPGHICSIDVGQIFVVSGTSVCRLDLPDCKVLGSFTIPDPPFPDKPLIGLLATSRTMRARSGIGRGLLNLVDIYTGHITKLECGNDSTTAVPVDESRVGFSILTTTFEILRAYRDAVTATNWFRLFTLPYLRTLLGLSRLRPLDFRIGSNQPRNARTFREGGGEDAQTDCIDCIFGTQCALDDSPERVCIWARVDNEYFFLRSLLPQYYCQGIEYFEGHAFTAGAIRASETWNGDPRWPPEIIVVEQWNVRTGRSCRTWHIYGTKRNDAIRDLCVTADRIVIRYACNTYKLGDSDGGVAIIDRHAKTGKDTPEPILHLKGTEDESWTGVAVYRKWLITTSTIGLKAWKLSDGQLSDELKLTTKLPWLVRLFVYLDKAYIEEREASKLWIFSLEEYAK